MFHFETFITVLDINTSLLLDPPISFPVIIDGQGHMIMAVRFLLKGTQSAGAHAHYIPSLK